MFISHTLSKTSRANYLLFLANLMVLCFKNYHMYYPDASPLMYFDLPFEHQSSACFHFNMDGI